MCGIAGYFSKTTEHQYHNFLLEGIKALSKRGPDIQNTLLLSNRVGFAHARLSIIDVSAAGNQPMQSPDGNFTIIFNGEIFNYRELRQQFLAEVKLHSGSDTEVLLNLYIKMGRDCLQHLNGFFALAIFDHQKSEVFLARDRFGIKPLHIYSDENVILFASELKALLKFPFKKEIDYSTLYLYLQLNYVPGTKSMLKNFQKLQPGCSALITSTGELSFYRYYSIPYQPGTKIPAAPLHYQEAKNKLRQLIEEAVERRLVSDVPLGTFLSGGIDSSIVSACAVKHVPQLNTFSLGYKDDPYFDETRYANLVAEKLKTNHTVFSVTTDEMFDNIFSVLDYIDEPFADSSSIAVFLLSKKTRQKVTVSLSGDGGDELFAGYNKHAAELRARRSGLVNTMLKRSTPVFKRLPQSRQSKAGNLFRQLDRYSTGLKLAPAERYWKWCALTAQNEAQNLLKVLPAGDLEKANETKQYFLNMVKNDGELNDVLFADVNLVLPGDMLTKVDLMSMVNSLEVRVPLLDFNVVNFAFSLPVEYKISGGVTKRILKDAFRDELPEQIFTRPKHGFEVPLLRWMQTGLRSLIEDDLLERSFIEQQNIFSYPYVDLLLKKLFSNNPGDAHATVWSLVVFQYWYKKNMWPNA
jgi:asparagine synthase (glutamine-hydrolysing)